MIHGDPPFVPFLDRLFRHISDFEGLRVVFFIDVKVEILIKFSSELKKEINQLFVAWARKSADQVGKLNCFSQDLQKLLRRDWITVRKDNQLNRNRLLQVLPKSGKGLHSFQANCGIKVDVGAQAGAAVRNGHLDLLSGASVNVFYRKSFLGGYAKLS